MNMANKSVKQSITHKEFVRLKALGISGLINSEISPVQLAETYTFVNNVDNIKKERLEEYNCWYVGDGDRLKNFFTRANAIDYNTDPLYNDNKKSYFWAVSSTESDIKRSHSGHPRNIVDTLVYIMGVPKISSTDKVVNENIQKILKANRFKWLITQKSRPLTLVEGWGAWKINWDEDLRDTPILLYYRAERVDFIYMSEQLRAIIYQDYYQDAEGKNYVLYETRRIGKYNGSTSLFIEKELYEMTQSDILIPCELTSLPQLKDVQPRLVIENFNRFLGCPSIFYGDSTEQYPGRSIFTGKCDLFDDADQCFSQSAMAVRRSTVHEYFNTLYLETDPYTGLPLMPTAFDRKYIQYKGITNGDGPSGGSTPVQVVQPAVAFGQYAEEERNILLNIINGIMSPATLGIDIAKKDNAEAQREKEKVTIFTRQNLIDTEGEEFNILIQDLLVANELMNSVDNTVTCKNYSITVKYDEFADTSFEKRLETVQTAWQGGMMTDEMAIEMLYRDTLSEDRKNKEIAFMKQQREAAQQPPFPMNNPEDMGAYGDLGAENPYNDAHEKAQIDDLRSDMGIPDLTSY